MLTSFPWLLPLVGLLVERSLCKHLNVVVVVNEPNDGAKEGIREAIEGAINSTSLTINWKEILDLTSFNATEVCQQVFADSSSVPDLLIDGTTRPNDAIRRMVRSMGLPTISANQDFESWDRIDVKEAKYLVHLKPPSALLVQAVADIIQHHGLTQLGLFYDESFAHLMEGLGSTVGLNSSYFEPLEGLEYIDLLKKVRKLRKKKNHTFFIMASMSTISRFSDAVNEIDLFRSSYTWYLVSKEKGRLLCSTCKHANMFVVRPSLCHLHDYLGKHFKVAEVPLAQKVDFYFYYDLVRMVLRPVIETNELSGWPSIQYPSCGGKALAEQQVQDRPNLLEMVAEESQEFHGKYGEFIVGSEGSEPEERYNYQDISMEISRLSILGDQKKTRKTGSWFYGEPSGAIIFKSRLEEDEAEGGGHKFIVAHHPPFVFKTTIPSNKTFDADSDAEEAPFQLTFTGFMIDLKDEIMRRYKERYNGSGDAMPPFLTVESEKYPGEKEVSSNGGQEGTGGWGHKSMPKASKKDETTSESTMGGMVGEVLEAAEITNGQKVALMPMTITAERLLFVDFTYPFMETEGLSILMKKPILKHNFFKFLTVLEYSVWLCITGAYFFTSIVLWIFDKTSPYSFRNNQEKYKDDDEKRIFTLKESLWFCITSLTPQGGGEAPKALSGRLVAATWWLFGFIIIASYTANLAAFLTVSRLEHKIDNLQQLSKQYKTKYAPFWGSSTMTYFERMGRVEETFYEVWKNLSLNDSLSDDERAKLAVWDYPVGDRYTKIWAQMSEVLFPKGYDKAIQLVKETKGRDGFALVAEASVIDYAVRSHCDLMKVGGEFSPRPNAFAVPKGWQYKDKWDAIIKELVDEGYVEKLREKWWIETVPEKVCTEHRKLSNGISLKGVGGVFLVISAGLIATVIGQVIENWYYKVKTSHDVYMVRNPGLQGANKPRGRRRCTIL